MIFAAPSSQTLLRLTLSKERLGRLPDRCSSSSLKTTLVSFAPGGPKGKQNFNASFAALETLAASQTFSMMSARPLRPLPTRTQLLSALIGVPELLAILLVILLPSPCGEPPMSAADDSAWTLLPHWT